MCYYIFLHSNKQLLYNSIAYSQRRKKNKILSKNSIWTKSSSTFQAVFFNFENNKTKSLTNNLVFEFIIVGFKQICSWTGRKTDSNYSDASIQWCIQLNISEQIVQHVFDWNPCGLNAAIKIAHFETKRNTQTMRKACAPRLLWICMPCKYTHLG